MMFWRQLGLSDAAAGVLAVLVMIIGGGTWLVVQGSGQAQLPPVEPVVVEQAAVAVPVDEDVEAPDDDSVLDTSPEQPVAEPEEPAALVAALPAAPQLDLVRVSPEGDAVVAGNADPGVVVVFLVNGVEITRSVADGTGSFVGLFEIPASDAPNSITVASEAPDGALISDESVLVAAIAAPAPVVEAPVPAVEAPVVADVSPVPDAAEPETPEQVAVLDVPEEDAEAKPPVERETTTQSTSDAVEPDDGTLASVETTEPLVQDVQSEATTETNESVQPEEPEQVAEVSEATELPKAEPLVEEIEVAEVVAPTPDPEPAPAPAAEQAPEQTLDQTPEPVVVQDEVAIIASTDASEVAPRIQSPAIASPEPRAVPTIVIANSDGVKVLQPARQPQAPTAEATANVVIDTITYDTEGEVALLGRGSGDGFVRIYLNDKPILTVPVDPDGSWETPLADVDAGVYRLRVDEISAAGAVTSRVETPFQREEVDIAADAPPTAVTVQPGSTLWAIAKDRFGDGVEYVRVYEANRELIRDPDLIYPGQVFALPTQ